MRRHRPNHLLWTVEDTRVAFEFNKPTDSGTGTKGSTRRRQLHIMSELGLRVEELSDGILSHPHADDWGKRNEALLALDELFDSEAATTVVAEDLKPLKYALENALNDLRSTLVKGACQVLETIARTARDACARLIRDLLPALVEQSGSANKVIKSYTDPCMLEVIRHVRFRQGIPAICSFAETLCAVSRALKSE